MSETKESAHAKSAALLTIDVRNLTTRFSLFPEGASEPLRTWETTTPAALTPDEALLSLSSHLASTAPAGENFGFAASIVSSVVPALTDAWVKAARSLCGRRPLVVGPGIKTGVKMGVNDPGELGSDRIANVVAAKARFGAPLLVVDVGATTNIEAIDANGAFCGGIIAPGMTVSARALSDVAARLACIPLQAPKNVIGKNTREAMQSGIIMGEIARIDGLVEMAWGELDATTDVVVTGANGAAIAALSKHGFAYDADLTAFGLKRIYELNRK